MNDNQITKHDFIRIFTTRPEGAGAMPISELQQRLDITLNQLKHDVESKDKRLPASAANCLRGALIRCAQTIDDPMVSAKIDELVAITADITGI